jgi:hypothetical protein
MSLRGLVARPTPKLLCNMASPEPDDQKPEIDYLNAELNDICYYIPDDDDE